MARYIFPAGSVTSTGTRQRLVPYLSTTDETPETEIAYVRGATETGKGRQSIVTDESGAYTAFVGPEGASTLHLERPNGTRVSVASSTATTDTTLAGASASALAADPAFTGTYAPLVARAASVAYSATVTPNADTTDVLNVGALTGNLTMAGPTGTPTDGQTLRVRFTQDGTGGRTVTWGAAYAFGSDVTTALIPTAAASRWEQMFMYSAGDSKWRAVAIVRGF